MSSWHILAKDFWTTLLTMTSHQNSATSPTRMDLSNVSQTSNLNIFPITTSIGTPTFLLSSITVRSPHSKVWKWNVTWNPDLMSSQFCTEVLQKFKNFLKALNSNDSNECSYRLQMFGSPLGCKYREELWFTSSSIIESRWTRQVTWLHL